MENYTGFGFVLFVFAAFFLTCLVFMPVFIWQIRNQTRKTNKLLKGIADAVDALVSNK